MNKESNICAICGKPISEGDISKDHVFPKAIYKWTKEEISRKEYVYINSTLNSTGNYVYTHKLCNYCKDDYIPNIADLYISKDKANALYTIHDKIAPYLQRFEELKGILMTKQGGKCYCCHQDLSEKAVIRRITPKCKRIMDNACLVCHECNVNNADFINHNAYNYIALNEDVIRQTNKAIELFENTDTSLYFHDKWKGI